MHECKIITFDKKQNQQQRIEYLAETKHTKKTTKHTGKKYTQQQKIELQ